MRIVNGAFVWKLLNVANLALAPAAIKIALALKPSIFPVSSKVCPFASISSVNLTFSNVESSSNAKSTFAPNVISLTVPA